MGESPKYDMSKKNCKKPETKGLNKSNQHNQNKCNRNVEAAVLLYTDIEE